MKIATTPQELDTFCKEDIEHPLDNSESETQAEKGVLFGEHYSPASGNIISKRRK